MRTGQAARRREGRAHRRLTTAAIALAGVMVGSSGIALAAPVGPPATVATNGAALRPGTLHLVRGRLPVSGVVPHASPSAEAGPTVSSNWSGQIATGGSYTDVSGSWTVPSVAAVQGEPGDYSATWIGIDGTSSQTLIQTGTAQETAGGYTYYQPWYELLPDDETPISDDVEPGDAMSATIVETSADRWTITLADATEHWTFSTTQTYDTPGASAEWIEEAPTIGTGQSVLADYGSTTFTDMSVAGTGSAASTYTPVYLENVADTGIVSWPTAYDAAAASFTVQYGSPTPVITGVSPASGSTSGDTVVTVSGQYLFAAGYVQFGATSTTDFYNGADGSLTVASPPGPSGTVDLRIKSSDTSSAVTSADHFTYASDAPKPRHGYWLVGADGGIFSFGAAGFHGSTGSLVLQRPVVGITPTADRDGYWLVATDGGVFAFGDATFYGSLPGLGITPAGSGLPHALDAPIVGMVPSADDRGYFMVAADGGVFAFGDAQFDGSCPGSGGCSGAAVSVLPDATGHGYWLVTATGYVYTFGDAAPEGEPLDYTDGQPLGTTIVSAVRTPDGDGYWVLAANGGVLPFGDANLYAGPDDTYDAYGDVTSSDPATAVFATGDDLGYWISAAGGAVYDFGSAPDDGSMAGQHLNAPIVAATGW